MPLAKRHRLSERGITVFSFDGIPGLYRIDNTPISADRENCVRGWLDGPDQTVLFYRDRHLEGIATKALGREWASPLDRWVCDCGRFTAEVAVTPDGLVCPKCRKEERAASLPNG